jgi:hypothetical protein
MNINAKVIEHDKHRYPTVGDWWVDDKNVLQIRSSRLSDARYEQLIILHELIEALLCLQDGVDEEAVTQFDIEFEAKRLPGNVEEPGDCVLAPYYKQHQIAMQYEKQLAETLGVNWEAYEKEIESL